MHTLTYVSIDNSKHTEYFPTAWEAMNRYKALMQSGQLMYGYIADNAEAIAMGNDLMNEAEARLSELLNEVSADDDEDDEEYDYYSDVLQSLLLSQ